MIPAVAALQALSLAAALPTVFPCHGPAVGAQARIFFNGPTGLAGIILQGSASPRVQGRAGRIFVAQAVVSLVVSRPLGIQMRDEIKL